MNSAIEVLAVRCREIPVTRERYVGVYFLISDGEIVYVGKSTDIQARLAQHRRQGVSEFDRVLWLAVDEADLASVEGAFIRALAPIETFAASADDSRDEEILASFGMKPDPSKRAEFEQRRNARWPRAGVDA